MFDGFSGGISLKLFHAKMENDFYKKPFFGVAAVTLLTSVALLGSFCLWWKERPEDVDYFAGFAVIGLLMIYAIGSFFSFFLALLSLVRGEKKQLAIVTFSVLSLFRVGGFIAMLIMTKLY